MRVLHAKKKKKRTKTFFGATHNPKNSPSLPPSLPLTAVPILVPLVSLDALAVAAVVDRGADLERVLAGPLDARRAARAVGQLAVLVEAAVTVFAALGL